MTMSAQGDDCYFYYYSTCIKGDNCPFRHCEAAMGSEVVCNLWQENRCFRKVCKFRHMEINKKRSEIPCYWEHQPAGCQKPHCAFHHEKPRVIDGVYVPPSKAPIVRKEGKEESGLPEPSPPAPASAANPANPQLRGVIKAETQENVPSPTHPPVVINTVDDEDEDEDDQISEEGEELKTGSVASRIASPRKVITTTDLGQLSVQACSDPAANVEKENIRSQTLLLACKQDAPLALEEPIKRRIAERLGKKRPLTGDQTGLKEDGQVEDNMPMRKRLADRLGKKVNHPQVLEDPSTSKAVKSVRERLGLLENYPDSGQDGKLAGEIRVKTLAEIKQEKMAKSQEQTKGADNGSTAKVPGAVKRLARAQASPSVRTFSEILCAKKKKEDQTTVPELQPTTVEKIDEKNPDETPATGSKELSEVRVKTLEEIRKEKAARIQTQNQSVQNERTPSPGDAVPKRRILCLNKTVGAEAVKTNEQKSPEKIVRMEEPVTTKQVALASNGKSHSSVESVRVKTFEEIMREKRLRKQQLEENIPAVQTGESCPAITPERATTQHKETPLVRAGQGESALSESSEAATQLKMAPGVSRQFVSLKRKAKQCSSPSGTVVRMEADSPSSSCDDSVLSAMPIRISAAGPILDVKKSQSEVTQKLILNEPSCQLTEPRVKPKVNVMPSVVKPTSQVKLDQKRKTSDSHRSAIAAVKPLNSTSAEKQESPSKHAEVPATSATLHRNAEDANSTTDKTLPKLESTMSPAKESLPVCPSTSVTPSALSQAKLRRQSVPPARASGSTVDDFDQLMSEFTDDRLETEMELDPGKGEDDLLLELSEMIDS